MAGISNAIVQGGLLLRETQDYDELKAARSHAQRARQFGVKRMESGERRMTADDSLLDQETAERQASLTDRGRSRDHQEAYRQLVSGGASFVTLAEEARKRGDLQSEKAFRDANTNAKREGLNDLVIGALTGADDAELERIYNGSGRDKVDPGSVKLDRKTGMLSLSRNGKPSDISMPQAGELLGILKRPEMKQTTVAPGAALAVDGKIVATNTAPDEYMSVAEGATTASKRTGLPPAAGGINQPGAPGQPGARPPRRDEAHEDARVKQLDSQVRFYLTGSNTFATMDPKTQARYDKLMSNAGQKVRAGMNPEAAATAAINEINHAEAALAAGGKPGGGAGYPGPTVWKKTP